MDTEHVLEVNFSKSQKKLLYSYMKSPVECFLLQIIGSMGKPSHVSNEVCDNVVPVIIRAQVCSSFDFICWKHLIGLLKMLLLKQLYNEIKIKIL